MLNRLNFWPAVRLTGLVLTGMCTLLVACATEYANSPEMKNRAGVLSFVNQQINQQPRYRSWPLFPSHKDTAAAADNTAQANYSREYYLKRLGMPVHGRWVTTYVNPVAHKYLVDAINRPLSDGQLTLPIGSMIVKENFRTSESFKATNNTDTSILSSGGALPRPAVLTILYKVGEAFCQTGYKFNGMDCFGGGWLWIYSGVNPISQLFDDQVVPRDFCINCHAPAYNSDYLRSLQSQRRFFRDKQQDFARLPGQSAPAEDVCEGLNSVTSELPFDVARDPTTTSNAQKMFDCLSWKTFVALNWPADREQRGQPDKKIKDVKSSDFIEGLRVWQTYKETYEVFQPTDPGWDPTNQDWNHPQETPAGKGCKKGHPVVSMISKSRSTGAFNVGNETGQAFAGSFGTLKDQNDQLVRYEVRFNRDEFDYILKTGSAITKNLTPAGPDKPNLPDNRTGKYGGAIEIKAAWREMCTADWQEKNNKQCFPTVDVPAQFYTQDVLAYYPATDGGKQPAYCEPKKMGLIALHIAHKTHWAPQWIWSTFSYKNNVPDANDPHAQATAFFDPARVPRSTDVCWQKPFLISPEGCPNVELNRFKRPTDLAEGTPWPGTDKPNQVTRLQPIEGSGLNQTFSKLLKDTPFANFVLLNTQWPLNGRDAHGTVNESNCHDNTFGNNCFTMIPRYLRNPVVETYMTTYNYQRQQYSNRSCMSCHTEGGANASYIWLDGVEQVVPINK